MQPCRPQRMPLKSDIQRVIGEAGYLFVITLVQADALAAFDIYGRYDFDGTTLLIHG